MLTFLHDVIIYAVSVTLSTLKTFVTFWGTCFEFWLLPVKCSLKLNQWGKNKRSYKMAYIWRKTRDIQKKISIYRTRMKLFTENLKNHSCSTKGKHWRKKDTGLFGVTMGPFDRAEISTLVGNFQLNELSEW